MAYMDFKNNEERRAFYMSDDGIELIKGWKREGISNQEIAIKYIGCGEKTLKRWSSACDGIAQAIYMTNDLLNSKVESALLKRALGYEYDEDTWELIEGELRKVKTVHKHVSPDVKACMNWLFSRRPDRWRAIQEPLESSQYVNTVKDILVAMKSVADSGQPIEIKSDNDED